MSNVVLFLLLVAASLVSLVVSIPAQARAVARLLESAGAGGRLAPPVGAAIAQSLTLAALASAAGVWLGRRAGLRAPFFESLAPGGTPLRALAAEAVPGTVFGLVAGVALVALYVWVLRPWAGPEAAAAGERLRLEMGFPSRVLMGGVYEEIVYRWGMMGLVAWIGTRLVGAPSAPVMWIAILVAALLFALGHLPGLFAYGPALRIPITSGVIGASVVMNVLGGVVFGWLLWQHGLFAAMLAHALAHGVLAPVERHLVSAGG